MKMKFPILIITIASTLSVSPMPFPDPLRVPMLNSRPKIMNSNSEAVQNKQEISVRDNLIQSVEISSKEGVGHNVNKLSVPDSVPLVLEQYGSGSEKYFLGKDSTQIEGKQHLSKFYRHGERLVSEPSSDAIVFPSSSLNFGPNENYDRPFSDSYSLSRPNIEPEPRQLPFNLGLGFNPRTNFRTSREPSNVTPNSNAYISFLTSDQEQLMYASLIQLFRGILFTPPPPVVSNIEKTPETERIDYPNPETESPLEDQQNADVTVETTVPPQNPDEDGVGYQSLYSGPRVQKSPCPNGQHRNHSGGCQEKSRKLYQG